ncbi:MAG TPA: TrmH family RNA methyltransferase [Candidatus Krumholzibacteria bacterium]|nr:TrmH family RNA methyltransferase [Candidatus Krumholzibacteria bacterium]HPD70862.1 TrmH family RNA methyltransferase [Candidatus Krumholzibacteria bacterium]HRY39438.1 TrmH family RNA methyltransferase [Candidatus Krumholzibacteria bacterium]
MTPRPQGNDPDNLPGNERSLEIDINGGETGERPGDRSGGRSGRSGRRNSGRGGRGGSRRRRNPTNGADPAASAEKLSSPQNPQIKALVRLRNRRTRDQEGLTVIEEPLVLRRAWESGYPLLAVYYSPELMTAEAKELLEDLRAAIQAGQTSVKLVEINGGLLRKVAYRDQPEGILAVAPQQRRNLEDLVLRDNPLLIVLENVEKPGNLGAALRIADGVGADAVLVTGEGTDLFNPNVLRASRGAFFTVPAVHCHIGEARDFLHERGLKVLATTPTATDTYLKADLTGPLAVVLGCEHDGLSEAWLKDEGCQPVRIPMRGHSDSLNVSTAAAVILYEALRQRALA